MPYIQPIEEEREKGRLLMAAKRNNTNGEITVDISVTLGTADLRVNQLLKLGRGAVVELDRDVNDYVDIYANNVLIGHGEVVITENETIGIAITDTVKKNAPLTPHSEQKRYGQSKNTEKDFQKAS